MDNPPSRKRAWREAAAPASASRPVEEAWRQDQGPARQGPPWWKARRARLAFVTSALLVVAVVLIVVALWPRRVPPMRLVLIGGGYEDNLFVPHAVEGHQGLKDLEALAEKNNNWGGQRTFVTLTGDADAVKRALEVPFLEKAPQTVVVFVSAHGLAHSDEGGFAPCLVPQDDNLKSAAALYRLDNLLDALANLPEKTKKLLLVDATGVSAHWPLGELHNDFARALAGRAQRISEVPNLVVISSSDKDQRSWVSPEWRQTYFAHFVIEGLQGAADGAATGEKNGRVDALELFRYVRAEVQRWAWHNRARRQTPVLSPSDDERARNMELVSCGDYQADNRIPEETDDDKPKKDFEDLEKAWEDCQGLRGASPHPAAYAPQLWRRYLDTLLRAEQLLRAGDSATATKLLGDLKDLHRRIEQSRSLELKSAQLTLAIPAALGVRLTETEQAELDRIARLWEASAARGDPQPKEYDQARSALVDQAGKAPLHRQLLRAALAGRLMRNVAMAPAKRLTYGRQSLEDLDAVAPDCRPAEVHYLMMLRPEVQAARPSPIDPLLKGPRGPELLRKSLEVRLHAEQAALGLGGEEAGEKLPAYSEQVLPWIRAAIEKADRQRRLGQDLLFTSGDPKPWEEAERLLDEARAGYVQAQKLAVTIRRALAVRDQVSAELPYCTHWVAEGRAEHEKLAIDLWRKLHDLGRRLGKPASGEAAIAEAAKLDELQHAIRADFQKLRGWIEKSADQGYPRQQDRWHEIEAALSVPFLQPNVRRNLIKASRNISRKLSNETPKEGAADSAGDEAGRPQARALALRQGRLALAVLGDDWPESARIKTELDNAVEETWRGALTRAGEAVGRLLNRLPEDADKQCEQAARMDDLKNADEALRAAARQARTIEGAAALSRMTRNPLDEQRRLNLHHLLCWQAQRTFLDWWAELRQTDRMRPYFQRAGEMFLEDAEQLVMGKSEKAIQAERSPRLKQVDAVYANLRAPVRMIVERSEHRGEEAFRPGPARFYLTDEDKVEWLYRLRGPAADQVPGHPVVWVHAERGPRVAAEDARRRTVAFDKPFAVTITEDSAVGRPPSGVAEHRVEGFFRGHRSQVETSIFMPVEPNRVVSLPPLWGRGRVAVQTKRDLYALYGAENAAVALVLDLSGSMYSVRPGDSTPRSQKAIKALESVLKYLPEGVTVSLWVFVGASTETGADGIKRLWDGLKWNPDRLGRLMQEVRDLKPAGSTPLIRTLWMAKNDLPEKKARSIIAITDGGDNHFYQDADLQRRGGRTLEKFLASQFGESDIQISVIGFEVNEKELYPEELRGYKEFKPAVTAIGGQYFDAQNIDQLTEYLARSLLHMYFQVYPDIGRDVAEVREKGQNISRSDKRENWRWVPLGPDKYRIRVPSVRSLKQSIEIQPGDALLLDLVRGLGGQPEFRRSVYAECDYITREHSRRRTDNSQKDWLLAVLQNHQLEASKELQLMATLEKYPDTRRSPDFLQQVHPGWVWFEVPGPEGANKPPSLRITSLRDYPADAWGLDVSDWPLDRPASILKAWWIDRPPTSRALLSRGVDFQQTPLELRSRTWRTDPQLGTVTLESIELKRCDLQVEKQRYKDVNCLIVRLSYPAEKEPFFVRLPNYADRKMGVEDRFYTSAGKYTGVFWPVTEEALRNIERLELFAVAELKKGALRVEKLELGRPNDRWDRPHPVRPKSEEP